MIKIDSVEIGATPAGKKRMAVDFDGTPIHTEVFTKCFLELLRRFDPDGSADLFEQIKTELEEPNA